MFRRLQEKWKLNGVRLALVLVTFALGGSLTGYAGRKILTIIDPPGTFLYLLIYIPVITLVWPLMVLLVSIPFGQFPFFRAYIYRLGGRLFSRSRQPVPVVSPPEGRAKNLDLPVKPQTKQVKHLTIFASGAGSNAAQIIRYFGDSSSIRVALIVCNKPGAGVMAIAEKEGIPVLLIEKERFFRGDGYLPELQKVRTELIVLAGFLWKIPQALIDAYPRRIINIHPALLPKYGGKGMYGTYVHQSVLNAGEVESGISIHYVDEKYDNGDIIFQTACPVLPGDTPDKLAQRIHQLEHLHYPRVIEQVIGQ